MEQLAKIYEVFSRFDEHNVVYCHWKSIDHLEATYLGDTDIDALFARNQRSLIETILAGCGFVRMDPMALASAIGSLLSDRSLRERLGHAARRRVEREYDWKKNVDQMVNIYEEIIAC